MPLRLDTRQADPCFECRSTQGTFVGTRKDEFPDAEPYRSLEQPFSLGLSAILLSSDVQTNLVIYLFMLCEIEFISSCLVRKVPSIQPSIQVGAWEMYFLKSIET